MWIDFLHFYCFPCCFYKSRATCQQSTSCQHCSINIIFISWNSVASFLPNLLNYFCLCFPTHPNYFFKVETEVAHCHLFLHFYYFLCCFSSFPTWHRRTWITFLCPHPSWLDLTNEIVSAHKLHCWCCQEQRTASIFSLMCFIVLRKWLFREFVPNVQKQQTFSC